MNILQHNIERFGMVTVMDVVLYDTTGVNAEPVLLLDTLKMTNITTEGSNKEVRGGIGNDLLISYDFGRTASIEMQDALVSPDSLAFLWGTNATAEGATNYHVVETGLAVDDGAGVGEIQLDAGVGFNDIVAGNYFALNTDGSEDKIAVAIDTAGVVTGALTIGEDYKVFFERTSSTGRSITLSNDNFPSAVKMIGTTFVIDQDSGKKKLVQIEIPKLKINSNFSFSMDAEGDASVFDFSGVALSNGGDLMKFKYLGNY